MKKVILMTLSLILVASIRLLAQNPVPDADTLQNPVKEGDPAVQALPPRMDYVDGRKRITPEEVPDAVRQSLESSAQYTDWQKATIYHDRNKDEYLVEFSEKGKTTSYRFSKDGSPVVEEK
jgi:hypothetical protein